MTGQAPSLYSSLEGINERPSPFSVYTADQLWADEHTSQQMLAFHLNGEIDVSSRRTSFIERSVAWMATRFNLSAKSKVIDFGCGPGLYTSLFAKLGASVSGVDFSSRSIKYAREKAAQDQCQISYHEADYLSFQPMGTFDLVTMIMCDFCALSPSQRSVMLKKVHDILAPDGRIVLDAYSLSAFDAKEEASIYERNLLGGFWSSEPYYGFLNTFKYNSEKVSLDKYYIVEVSRQRKIYNWLQYFSLETLEQELVAAGLAVEEALGNVAGDSFDDSHSEFAILARKR